MTMPRFATASWVTVLSVWLLAWPAQAHDHSASRGRLVATDFEKPLLRVLDLDNGEWTHSFPLPRANPTLTTSHDGRYVFVRTGDATDAVKILDTGVVSESHGDHIDIEKRAVELLGITLAGERPSHITSGFGQAGVFFDGPRGGDRRTGSKAILLELASLHTKEPRLRTWDSPGAQHGLAVPLGPQVWALSMPNPTYVQGDGSASSLPEGLAVMRAGELRKPTSSLHEARTRRYPCRELHGHAVVAQTHVFGCSAHVQGEAANDSGLLVLGNVKGKWIARKIAYPDDRRASQLVARAGSPVVVANYGRPSNYTAFLRIDPKATALGGHDVFAVPGDQPTCQFALSQNGRRVANLLPDGTLRIYEHSPAWREVARFEAVAPFDCGHGKTGPVPSLSVVGRSAFVSDPAARRIREYDLTTLKQGLDIAFDGIPAALAPGGSD